MSKFIIKATPTENCNRDFLPEEKLIKGVECDQFLILGFKNGHISFESVQGLSVEELREYLLSRAQCASIIMQAAQIAEGYLRAIETYKRYEKDNSLELFKELILDVLGDEKKEK